MRRAHLAGCEVPKRSDEAAGPVAERGARAGHVDQSAERIAAEEGALGSAHEFDLFDVDQLDARRVRVELRHAVDVGGDAGVVRARADASETRIAQLARGELVKERVGRVVGRVADGSDGRLLERFFWHGRNAHRRLLPILWRLLGGDGNDRQTNPQRTAVGIRLCLAGCGGRRLLSIRRARDASSTTRPTARSFRGDKMIF